jgi:hypothetical protein
MSEQDPQPTTEEQPENQPATPDTTDAEKHEQELADAAEAAGSDPGGMDMMSFLEDGGIKNLLMQDTYENRHTGHTYSQADLLADIVNVMRMDTKQMAALHGIDIEVDKMQPDRAAELVESMAGNGEGSGLDIIDVFQEIEDQRDLLFQQEMTDDQYDQYMTFKARMLYSVDADKNPDI